MSELSAAAVARHLQENPDFFVKHADVFATLAVPHPYQDRAVSLGERQVLTLRDKVRALETQLATLIREAQRNEAISGQLNRWCQRLLAADAARLPETLTTTLVAQFGLQDAALRVWQPDATAAGMSAERSTYSAAVDIKTRRYAASLATPYCGNDATLPDIVPIMAWLDQSPKSFALIALRHEPQAPVFGLLVLAADDPQRFTTSMATDFLAVIGSLASAALTQWTVDSV